LLVDVRERTEVGRVAFDVPGIVVMPLSEFEQRFAELPRDRELVLACASGPRKGFPIPGARAVAPAADEASLNPSIHPAWARPIAVQPRRPAAL